MGVTTSKISTSYTGVQPLKRWPTFSTVYHRYGQRLIDFMMSRSIEEVTEKIFSKYRRYGGHVYQGEAVTQLEHATQAAMRAEEEGHPTEIILGVFLHDIGHLLEEEGAEAMIEGGVSIGVAGHEVLGEKFLGDLGVPSDVTDVCRGHVDAKRYLCWKTPHYHQKLSQTSKMTLIHQGGPMEREEAETFQKKHNFDLLIRSRHWDEEAKIQGLEMPPLEKYENMFREYMKTLLL